MITLTYIIQSILRFAAAGENCTPVRVFLALSPLYDEVMTPRLTTHLQDTPFRARITELPEAVHNQLISLLNDNDSLSLAASCKQFWHVRMDDQYTQSLYEEVRVRKQCERLGVPDTPEAAASRQAHRDSLGRWCAATYQYDRR